MPTRNVHLTERLDRLIEDGVQCGRFSDASEVVREGLRLLEQRDREDAAKVEWLRASTKQGFDEIDRGDFVQFGSMDDLARDLHDVGEEVFAEVNEEGRCA